MKQILNVISFEIVINKSTWCRKNEFLSKRYDEIRSFYGSYFIVGRFSNHA